MADAAQYAINIAARMTGTETFAQLDELTATLAGAGKGAEHFGQAIQRVSSELAAATTANQAASTALADGRAQYAQLERAALNAAKAAERAALKNGGAVPPELAANAAAAAAKLDAYGAELRQLEGDAARAAQRQEGLARMLTNVRTLSAHVDKRLAMNSENLAKLQAGLSASGTSAGRLGANLVAPVKGFADLSQVVGTANAAMLVAASAAAAVVVALGALAAAAVAAGLGVAAWAVKLSDAGRSLGLAREAAEAFHPELVALRGDIATIADGTGVSSESLRKLAGDLQGAGVAAGEMPAALRAAALAEAALGQGGAASFVADIKAGKLAVADFAATTEAKLGGIVARQMLGLEAQGARFKSNLSGLFGELDIESALGGLNTLVGLFDKNTAAGRMIKAVFETVFQPLIDNAQQAAWVVEAFVLGVLIGATKLYIKMKPAIKAVAELFDIDVSNATLEDVLAGVADAGEILAPVLLGVGAAVASVVAGVGLLAGAFGAINLATAALLFGTMGRAIYTIVVAASGAADTVRGFGAALGGAVTDAVSFARGALLGFAATLGGVGGDIVRGLAAGITAAAPAIVGAMKGAVDGALRQAKAALGIASPSRVFAVLGGFTGEGFVRGVEAEAPAAHEAMAAMVAPPELEVPELPVLAVDRSAPMPAPATSPTSTTPVSSVRAPSVSFAGAVFNFSGIADAADAAERFGEVLTRLLEGDAAQLAGEVAVAT